jgi:hypothetical protein
MASPLPDTVERLTSLPFVVVGVGQGGDEGADPVDGVDEGWLQLCDVVVGEG